MSHTRCVLECKRDENGYHWIVGRLDDCINVSSHLLSSTEIEGALLNHKAVSEAAVVNTSPCVSFFPFYLSRSGVHRKSNTFQPNGQRAPKSLVLSTGWK